MSLGKQNPGVSSGSINRNDIFVMTGPFEQPADNIIEFIEVARKSYEYEKEGAIIVPDGNGMDWRRYKGQIQHRMSADNFRSNRPGTWIDTPHPEDIIRLDCLRAIAQLTP